MLMYLEGHPARVRDPRSPRRTHLIRRFVHSTISLILAGAGLTGCGLVSSELDGAINAIDQARQSIEGISSSWRDELPKLKRDLEGLESRAAADAKTVVADATSQVQDLADHTIQLSAAKAQDLIAQAGVEFRCNTDFVKAGVVQQLRYLVDDLKFWKSNKTRLDRRPNHTVCWMNPTVLSLYPSGDHWDIDESIMSDKGIVHIFGYNFQPNALPVLEIHDGSGNIIRPASVKPSYVTQYQLNLDMATENFASVQPGARIVLRWPDIDDPNTINLTLHPPAKLTITNPSFSPAAPKATKDTVTLKVTVSNTGGSPSREFTITWIPDPFQAQPFSATPGRLQAGDSVDVSLGGYVFQRGGRIESTVALSNGGEVQIYPIEVAPPPVTRPGPRDYLSTRDSVTGKVVGGTGEDRSYGGPCSPGYVRLDAYAIKVEGDGEVWLKDWKDPGDVKNCAIIVHFSVKAGLPVRTVTANIGVREIGE